MELKNVNLSKFFSLKGVSLVLVTATLVGSLTGCGKKADCSVNGNHAHLYNNEYGYSKYIESEYLTDGNYVRNNEYIPLSQDEEELYKFLNKKDLLKISENIDTITNQQCVNTDYVEYRYKYTYLQPIPHYMHVGKTTSVYFTYIPITHYSWTDNKEHSRLTGEQRLCHYVYTAYRVEKDEKGKYILIPSPEVDDITEVMSEYPYIKENYYKAIDVEYGTDLDYEDGPSLLSPEEQDNLEVEYQGQLQDQTQDNEKSLKKTK